jgi:hypothetical protein
MRGFQHVTVVRVGALGLPASIESRLMGAATEVVDEPSWAGGDPRVTLLGPPEVLPRERPRQIAGAVVRALRRARGRLAQRSATTLP